MLIIGLEKVGATFADLIGCDDVALVIRLEPGVQVGQSRVWIAKFLVDMLAIGLKPGMHVLDVASALGAPARHIAKDYGFRVTGLDFTAAYVEEVNKRTKAAGLDKSILFVSGNAMDMPFPADTFELGQKLLDAHSPHRLIGDHLAELFQEDDLSDLYTETGGPAISPVVMAVATVLQTLDKLPDRQAAEAVRVRLDWK